MNKRANRKKQTPQKLKRNLSASSNSEEANEFSHLNKQGTSFTIKTSKRMGRYMVSTKQLNPGETILSELPIVVGPCTGSKVQCLGCYKPLESSSHYKKCPGCHWPLCSLHCQGLGQKYGHSVEECNLLKSTKSSSFFDYDDFDKLSTNFNAIVPLRCLLLKHTDLEAHQLLLKMEDHNEIRKNIPDLWNLNQSSVVDRIIKDWGLNQFTEEEIHSICGVLEVNSFELGQQGSIRGLYPTAFLMSHDCVPNTNHIDEENTYSLIVRASTKIEPGQMITLSYAYTLQSTLKRREHLLEHKFFECECDRCSDSTELGAYSGALMCPKCSNGFVLSTNPLKADSNWKCINTKNCTGYQVTAKSMQLLINRISQESDSIDCNNVIGMEAFLKKYRNVLHPAHYLNLNIKLSLSQIYGRINGYLIDELNEDLLIRKHEICEEILKIFDIIEPGYTRLRGVTLYEMHAPLMILLTRHFHSHCSKSELRSKLRLIVKCLEEASLILGYESQNSSEGIMGMAANDALIKIKNWEKIVGKL